MWQTGDISEKQQEIFVAERAGPRFTRRNCEAAGTVPIHAALFVFTNRPIF
jgi:hypothetical protein